jgi:hypothetical protein
MRWGPFSGVHLAATLLGFATVTVGSACSLVVDTAGLSGGGGVDSSTPSPDSGSIGATDTGGGAEPDSARSDALALDDADTAGATPDGGGATDAATESEAAGTGPMDATAVDSGTPETGTRGGDASDGGSGCASGNARVFVTSAQQSQGGNLGGTAGADSTCNAAAAAASIGGSWNAWLSDSHAQATSRIYKATGAYTLVDGATVVASSYTALVSGTLSHAIDVTEKGALVTDGQTEVWTGTDLFGAVVYGYCTQSGKDWNSMAASNSGTPMVGHLNVTDATWTDAYYQTCDRSNVRLYCFERCP